MRTTRRAGSLEQALSKPLAEVTPGRGLRLEIFVQGRSRALNAATWEQLFLIGREAIMNALRHSEATKIEVEIQYLRNLLHLVVLVTGNAPPIRINLRPPVPSRRIISQLNLYSRSNQPFPDPEDRFPPRTCHTDISWR